MFFDYSESTIINEATKILKNMYGEDAKFREGQVEAIVSIFINRRTLVVEKTGWGKSLVYFIACKLLRERKSASTVVVSPLLSLMDNQFEAAHKLGLKCITINSTKTKEEKQEIIDLWSNDYYDLIFITPETLLSEIIQNNKDRIRIGFFVIDEVHCISDYGHDFRLKYMRLKEIINALDLYTPILGVTATATDRVINDLKNQIGDELFVLRGPLTRKSLNIQVINLENMPSKYAWILSNISLFPGTGIIYCLTQHDCDELNDFLIENGINSLSYHNGNSNEENNVALNKFKNDEIKVLVATIKLGMGYDKGNISFVIHLQMAENIVSYYQQIGRAGRSIPNAYIILLNGANDRRILDYFVDSAFPSRKEQETIYEYIKNNNGVSLYQICSRCNYKKNRIEKALMFLENDNYVFIDEKKYYSTANKFVYNEEHYNEIRNLRRSEINKMIELTQTEECYSKFIVNELDDGTACECGKCSNCINRSLFDFQIKESDLWKAEDYIYNRIHLKKHKTYYYSKDKKKKLDYIINDCICLSYYGDYGFGSMLEYDKYNSNDYREEIFERCKEIIEIEFINKGIEYITVVPSNRNKMVENLARKLALDLDITFVDLLNKDINTPLQKTMENNYYQSENARVNYSIKEDKKSICKIIDKIILIDDILDSGWTLTWCGYYLMQAGIREVYPFTISDSSNRRKFNE